MSVDGINSEDFFNFSLIYKQTEQLVVREIIRATEDVVYEPAVEDVVAALA